jgi:ribosome-associated protein
MISDEKIEEVVKFLEFKTSRSSGKGGQHVNKVSSKVELIFNLQESELFIEDEKTRIENKFRRYYKLDGCIHMICQADRSQIKNKKTIILRFVTLLEKAFQEVPERVKTTIPTEEKKRRLEEKKMKAQKKERRKFSDF